MPRTAREQSESGVYHIMIRGIGKQNIFEDDADKEKLYIKHSDVSHMIGNIDISPAKKRSQSP